jgi:hypothetical protein
MAMTKAERERWIERYGNGVAVLQAALAQVPGDALRFKPAPDKWSVHEIVAHCADSETNAAMRIRYLVGEERPAIQGYDQNRWVRALSYETQSLELALAQVTVVRSWTAALLRALPEDAWARAGTHSEMPGQEYGATTWLEIYGEHLDVHARQIGRNVAAWRERGAAPA